MSSSSPSSYLQDIMGEISSTFSQMDSAKALRNSMGGSHVHTNDADPNNPGTTTSSDIRSFLPWEVDDRVSERFNELKAEYTAARLAIQSSRIACMEAGSEKLHLLRKSLAIHKALVRRSECYRAHRRYVARLAAKLLLNNIDLEHWSHHRESACSPSVKGGAGAGAGVSGEAIDELWGLRHYAICYQLFDAVNILLVMDKQGKKTRRRSERFYHRIVSLRECRTNVCESIKDERKLQVSLKEEMEELSQYLSHLDKNFADGRYEIPPEVLRFFAEQGEGVRRAMELSRCQIQTLLKEERKEIARMRTELDRFVGEIEEELGQPVIEEDSVQMGLESDDLAELEASVDRIREDKCLCCHGRW